jgi:hypothetical protein
LDTTCDPTNQAPAVDAGLDQSVAVTESAGLAGTVVDDGLPVGGLLQVAWSTVSGPGVVTFADPTAPATTAMFSGLGTYVLRLSATDGDLTAFDDVTVEVEGTVGCDLEGRPPLDPVRVTVGPGSWDSMPEMASPHSQYATATLLPSGDVLVAGGWLGSTTTAAADPTVRPRELGPRCPP